MPDVRLAPCLMLCIRAVYHEHQRTKGNNCQLCFHHDFSPVIPLLAQAGAREIESDKSACDDHDTQIPAEKIPCVPSRPRHPWYTGIRREMVRESRAGPTRSGGPITLAIPSIYVADRGSLSLEIRRPLSAASRRNVTLAK
jgi:hypothetical protein